MSDGERIIPDELVTGKAYDLPKGHVVMSGCILPVNAPLPNIYEMMNTVRNAGYQIKPERVERLLSKRPQD